MQQQQDQQQQDQEERPDCFRQINQQYYDEAAFKFLSYMKTHPEETREIWIGVAVYYSYDRNTKNVYYYKVAHPDKVDKNHYQAIIPHITQIHQCYIDTSDNCSVCEKIYKHLPYGHDVNHVNTYMGMMSTHAPTMYDIQPGQMIFL